MNKRKKADTSRSKKDSTVSPKAYKDMKAGWPKKGKSNFLDPRTINPVEKTWPATGAGQSPVS